MTNELVPVPGGRSEQQAHLINLATRSVVSENSKRAYASHLKSFFSWLENSQKNFDRQTVQEYRDFLHTQGIAPRSINAMLSAIRTLATEARYSHLLAPETAQGIIDIKGVRGNRVKSGNWLSKEAAQLLINAPDAETLKGKRDRVVLGLLMGCGLRRSEVVSVRNSQLQQRDGRWMLIDVKGKGDKTRSVPVPGWVKALIDKWHADIYSHLLGDIRLDHSMVMPVLKGDNRLDAQRQLDPNTIWYIVREYSEKLSKVAPHDLRRTFGKLAESGGADIRQIQLSLGHSDLRTTELYLNADMDLQSAPCDVLGIKVDLS